MWNNDDDGSFNNEGGFDNTGTFASPATQSAKSSKPKCLANVSIKQIIQSQEEGIKIRDTEVQVVKVVGIVKFVEVTSVKIRYDINDHTGTITGFVYLENDSADTNSSVVENTYCVVTGSLRTQGKSKHIMIFSINPIEDFNYILKHLLTVVYMPLKLDSISSGAEQVAPIKSEMMSSYGSNDFHGNEVGADVDPRYRRVFEVISKSMNENGMNITEIKTSLPSVTIDQIRNALEYLVGEGHIFTTIDENHYKSIHSTY